MSTLTHLTARAPTRLDFGGGWTDVPPYTTEQGGRVCNVAIERFATARLWRQADASEEGEHAESALARAALRRAGTSGVALAIDHDYPLGAGLGGSSAAGVAAVGALAAWRGESLSPDTLAQRSRATEVEDLGIAGGYQDHYAAAYGGALDLAFTDRVEVRRIPLADATVDALDRRLVVAYTGQSRISGDTITAVLDAYRARERRVTSALACMKELAGDMAAALEAGDVDALGALVGEHWVHQRALHLAITTPLIDAVMEAGRRAGALGGKALGASGGGCVLLVAPAEGAEALRRAVAGVAQLLPVRVSRAGFHVVESH